MRSLVNSLEAVVTRGSVRVMSMVMVCVVSRYGWACVTQPLQSVTVTWRTSALQSSGSSISSITYWGIA